MTTPHVPHVAHVPHGPTALRLTPECAAAGCSVAGDQDTLVRCHDGGWWWRDHIAAQEGVRLVPGATRVLRGLASDEGMCLACQQGRPHAFSARVFEDERI